MRIRRFYTAIIAFSAITLILANVTTAQPTLPAIGFNPRVSTHPQASTFTIDVTISGVTLENTQGFGVVGWEVDISFNSTVLNVLSVQQGPWLKAGTKTVMWITPKIDNTAGTVIASASLFPVTQPGTTGSGTLANITFTVVNKGSSDLHFYKTSVRAYNPAPPGTYLIIDHTVVDGFFQYPMGDTNNDGDVDYDDFIVLAGAYGSSLGQPAYKENADFDRDGDVDYDDFIALAGNYGIG